MIGADSFSGGRVWWRVWGGSNDVETADILWDRVLWRLVKEQQGQTCERATRGRRLPATWSCPLINFPLSDPRQNAYVNESCEVNGSRLAQNSSTHWQHLDKSQDSEHINESLQSEHVNESRQSEDLNESRMSHEWVTNESWKSHEWVMNESWHSEQSVLPLQPISHATHTQIGWSQ